MGAFCSLYDKLRGETMIPEERRRIILEHDLLDASALGKRPKKGGTNVAAVWTSIHNGRVQKYLVGDGPAP